MSILSRVKLSPQMRYDLEDFYAEQSAARTDSKLWTQKFLSESNYLLNGFSVSGIGLTQATVAMTNAAFIIPQNSFDFSYFVSEPSAPNVVISAASLVDNARNYVEAQLTTQDGTPLTRAFWDPDSNSGLGQEFNQIVNTMTDLKCSFVTSTGGFSGSPDRLPIAIIDCDGSGIIKVILDRRNLFGRLATPSNVDNNFAWGSKVEPTYSLTMSGVSGTFVAGETITIGSETATVTTGGTSPIQFNVPSGINFGNGDSVTGGTSGATGTVNTVAESFTGVDKSLTGQKNINDALMTEIKAVKGTRFWWQTGASIAGLKQEVMSTIAAISATGYVKWDGSKLVIADNSLTPASTDNIAAVRLLNSSKNLYLRRQDDGKEVVTITLSDIPDTGILTLNQNGNSIAINWNDSTSQIQTTWNGSGAYAATISGSPAAKKIVVTANAAGVQVDVTETSNTLTKSGSSVTPTYAIKQGTASDASIAIADGQVLYVDIPSPLADTNYSGVGSGASNYKLAARGSPALVDSTYWLAYREGSNLVWRFSGELQTNEASQISDTIPQSLLDAIGLASETSMPSYDSDIRGVASESLVRRVSVLTNAVGDEQEDRSAYLRSDDKVTWTGTQLQFTSDIILEILNTKNGTLTQHRVLLAGSPLSFNNLESYWVLVDRSQINQTLTVNRTSITPIPAQVEATKNVFVLFRRVDAGATQCLHIPLHKQVLEPSITRLGASGAGSGSSSGVSWMAGQVNVTNGTDSASFTFSTPQPDESYVVLPTIENTVDAAPKALQVLSITKTVTGFTVKFNDVADSVNYKLNYLIPLKTLPMAEVGVSSAQLSVSPNLLIPENGSGYGILAFLQNRTDASPQFQPVVVTAKSSSTFTVSWNDATDSSNSVLVYTKSPTGIASIGSAQSSVAVNVPVPFNSTNYVVICGIENTTDPSPLFQPLRVTAKSGTQFTVSWDDPTDSANYKLVYYVISFA